MTDSRTSTGTAKPFHPANNLPGCMMPDGGECCGGYVALVDDWHKQRKANDALVKALERIQPLLNGDRPTVNEQNIWEHWRAQNALLIDLRQIVDAALSQVRP